MEVTLKIDGMSCPHCETVIERSVKWVPGVLDVKADHETGTAMVTLSTVTINKLALSNAVEEHGYTLVSIS